MEKYCLMILNCKKYEYKRELQRKLWLPFIKIRWFHVIGDPYIWDEFKYDKDEHILYVRCPDTYESLPMKTYLSFVAVQKLFPEVQYLLKTDDDMKCNLDKFEDVLNAIEGYDYGGEFIKIEEDHESKYHYPNVPQHKRHPVQMLKTEYCPGRFYFLSKNARRNLIAQRDFFEKQVFEDYAVGYASTRIPNMRFLNVDAKSIFYDDVT